MDKNKRKSFDRNSKIVSSSEEVTSEINLKSMFAKLEYNHRRLLGVTSALTEALENTVRGSPFELEETLNKCMEIYPELFTLRIRKPSKNSNFKKIYNTSVSEDVTDTAESEKKTYSSFQIQSDTDQSIKNVEAKQKIPSFTFDKETQRKYYSNTESRQSTAFTNPENMKNITSETESFSTQPIKRSNIPKIYKEPSFEVLLNPNDYQEPTNDPQSNKNPKNLSAQPSPSPEFKNYSFSSRLSGDESSVFISPVTEREFHLDNTNTYKNQTPITENSYTVKHPESDTDYSTHGKDYTLDNQYDNNSIMEDPENPFGLKNIHLPSEHNDEHDAYGEKNSKWPYEIIVQQKGSEEEDPDAELSIKIIPDMRTSNERRTFTTQRDRSFQHMENQNPVETHIIIKKQFNNNNSSQMGNFTNDEFIFNSPTEKISVTIAKLQSLSTGLRAQSGVLRPNQTEVSRHQSYHSENAVSSSEYPTKIALMNSYNVGNSPKIKDEAFEEIKNDFISIKSNLIEGSVKQRSQILQSLRLNLIHTLAKERSSLLDSYIENDIFDIRCDPTLLDILMPKEIINGWDLLLQQTVLKFLNTISSMWKGRDYLTMNLKTLNCLQKYFFDKYSMRVSSEMTCKDMLVATFHKLSTRKSQQISLINAGVSEKILFSVLENRESISAYRLLHSLGLLINLCINSQGAQQMEPMSPELLTLLATLLQSKENKIVPYAARLLYILMGNDKFHKEAKNMDIVKILDESIKISNKRMKLQLDILKSAIEQPKAHNHLSNAEETYLKNIEAEIDELEEEVEVGEPGVTNAQSESYKKSALGSETNLKVKEEIKLPQEYAFSKEDEIKNTIAQSSTSLQTKTAMDNNATEDKKSNETKSELSQIEENKKLEEKEKVKKSEEKGKNKKSKKKRDRDTDSLLSSNYILLKEALNNIIDDQANYNIIPETAVEEIDSQTENLKQDENKNLLSKDVSNVLEQNGKEKETINSEKGHVTSNQESSKEQTTKDEMRSLKEEIKNSKEEIKNPKEEINTNTASSNGEKEDRATPLASKKEFAGPKSRPPSQKSEHLMQRRRKHSLYSQDGNNDYDYCEDTKQIQVPIQHHNIFSDSRQSPYKGLFTETNKDASLSKMPPKEKETNEAEPDSPIVNKSTENREGEKN